MVLPTSHMLLPPLDAILKECVEAFRILGAIRRCSIILLDDDLTQGTLRAGFDVRDPNYPPLGVKIPIKDYKLLENCIATCAPLLLTRPFEGGWPVLWEEVPRKEQVTAIGVISLSRDGVCYGIAVLLSEEKVIANLGMRFHAWQAVGLLFSNVIAYHISNSRLLYEKNELENILNGIGHGVVILDRDLRILRANLAMAEMLGRTPAELIGTPYEQLCRVSGIWSEPCPVKEAFITGKVTHATKLCHIKEPEQKRYLKVSCFPHRNSSGQVTQAIVYLRDVSVIVRAEMLQKDLTHMVIHDIRNPLLAARQTLDLSVSGSHGWITRHHRDVLRATQNSCSLLLSMLEDMLDVYRNEAGEMVLNLQQVQVQEMIHQAIKAIEALADEKSIQIQFNLAKDLLAFYGDETRLIRVMINLLDNAIKFSPKQSRVIVDAQINSEGSLKISVTNSGRAIPPEHLEKIFWKFYQVEKESGIKKAGVGLGLAFCRLAIEAHGGRIWAESPVNPDGQGSRFTFTIPIKSP